MEHAQKDVGAACGTSELTDVLARTVREARAAIEEATMVKNSAVAAADAEWRNATRPHEQRLNDLERQYADRAIDLAEDQAPVNRMGSPLHPDSVWVTEAGIELRWDADHPNDIVDATVTWIELSANAIVSGLPLGKDEK